MQSRALSVTQALTSYLETPEVLHKDFSVFSNILMIQGENLRNHQALVYYFPPPSPFLSILEFSECH